jgi:hypothetical protein
MSGYPAACSLFRLLPGPLTAEAARRPSVSAPLAAAARPQCSAATVPCGMLTGGLCGPVWAIARSGHRGPCAGAALHPGVFSGAVRRPACVELAVLAPDARVLPL